MIKKTHLALARPGYAELLREEFADRWGISGTCVNDAAVSFAESVKMPAIDTTVFMRQVMPLATPFDGADVKEAVEFVVKKIEVMAGRPNRQKGRWTVHVFALDDDVGTQRAVKLDKALLVALKARLPRFFDRFVSAEEMAKETPEASDVLIQVYLAGADKLWLSTGSFGTGVSPYIGGNLRMRDRAGAPSRSARKLEEALFALGRSPKADEVAVDLGAAPGGWTFAMARHGALVTAVDHAALALPEGKALASRVTHLKDNGLKYMPPVPVDWLCCDMVIGSRETLRVLAGWLEKDWMRHFIVNVKLPGDKPWPVIKEALELLASHPWTVMKARHLYHDRREITLMGSR